MVRGLTVTCGIVAASIFVTHAGMALAAGAVTPDEFASRSGGADRPDLLARHNTIRAAEGSAPLAWHPELAAASRVWARRIAGSTRPGHSYCSGYAYRSVRCRAENIAWAGSLDQAFGVWARERAAFHRVGGMQGCSLARLGPSGFKACGHYKNMVSPHYTRVGCGRAGRILVCQYGR